MLSFVVQNFYLSNTVVRTKKYNSLIMSRSTSLFFLFFKNYTHIAFYKQTFVTTTSGLLRIFNKNFIKPFWAALASMDDFRYGLYTNNLSKSLTGYALEPLVSSPYRRRVVKLPRLLTNTNYLLEYVLYLPTLSFPFKNNLYNHIIIYFLNFIVQVYVPARQQFKLMYNFILLPKTFNLYMFCNSFYFRIWNY